MKVTIYIISIISLISSQKLLDLRRNQVQKIYTAELGVKEKTGKNDGPRIEEYLRQVGLKKGDPWCAAFVCWVFDRAGVANPQTGWSPGLFAKSKVIWERGRKVAVGTVAVAGKKVAGGRELGAGKVAAALRNLPQKGDVFGIWFADKGRIAHVGFVDSWTEKWLITVEGNTNEAGSREGDGVWRKRRLVRSVWQVSQFVN